MNCAQNDVMKIFVSSLISGMGDARSSARQAISELDHEPLMAEDFGAQPRSPQIACLDGVRQSAAVVLILGPQYGAIQASGLSATHEEYREARSSRPVFAFVRSSVAPDPEQTAFIQEVEGWPSGLYRESFSSAEDLRQKVVRAIHRWELSTAATPLNGAELLERARANVPDDRRGNRLTSPTLLLSVASGPTQPVLRPSQLDERTLQTDIHSNAMFGASPVLDSRLGSELSIRDDALVITQDRGGSVSVDTQGSIVLHLPIARDGHSMSVIEEDVRERMVVGIGYIAWILDRIDPTQRLSHVAVVTSVLGADYQGWRTRAQQSASSGSYSMRSGDTGREPVSLRPAHRPRAALTVEREELVTDLITLLRRQMTA